MFYCITPVHIVCCYVMLNVCTLICNVPGMHILYVHVRRVRIIIIKFTFHCLIIIIRYILSLASQKYNYNVDDVAKRLTTVILYILLCFIVL